MADSKVGILIEAKDNASSTIKNVKNSVNDLGKSAGEMSTLSGAFSTLGKAAGLAGVAFGAIEVGKQVVELAQYSAQVQRTEAAFTTFSQQAGLAANTLDMLRSASRGTISDFDLMQSSNRALALGVADSSQELTQLLEVAIARGKALGVSANQAFSDLVTGIGRMSPLILDNLGIITGGEKLFDAYAASIGKATSALTDQERKQALVNKVISESKELVAANATAGDDAASSFERASAAFQNIKADLGSLFGPAIAAFADKLAQAVDQTANTITNLPPVAIVETGTIEAQISVIDGLKDRIENAQEEALSLKDALGRSLESGVTNQAELQFQKNTQAAIAYQESIIRSTQAQLGWADSQLRMMQNAGAATAANASLANQINALTGTYPALNAANVAASQAMENQRAAAINLQNQIVALANTYPAAASQIASAAAVIRGSIMDANQAAIASLASGAFDTQGADGAIRVYGELNDQIDQQIAGWQSQGYALDEINNILLPGYLSQVRRVTTETYGIKAAQTGVNAAIKQASAEYEDLKSKVSGVLSGALGDIGGVNFDEILPRTDSVSEDARRLADVAVNGFASPWADYLSNKFPDTIGAAFSSGGDIKQTAAQLLKDFQDGLRPELLDKEKAKDLVRRAIVGEKNLKSLTDEIAKELAGELGVSVEQAQAAAAQALGGGGATGGASGATAPKQVPIVPTIDTSKLPTTPISVKGEISSVTVSSSLTTYTLSIKSEITSVTIADTVTNPQIASTAAIGELVIAEGAKVPTPVITGGLSIDVVSVRSDAAMPTVILPATVTTVTLGDNVTNPQIASTAAIGNIVIAEGVTPPVPVLTGGLYIDAVALRSDVVLPTITLGATITAYSISSSATTEKPLALSARVTPFIDTASITDEQFVSAATFITESMPVLVTPQITVTGIDTSTALTYLESELAPIVTPYINYLGIPPEDLQAGGLVIGDGLKLGIVASNIGGAIVTEINKAQELIRSSGKTSGTNWGAGFLETVGQNVPSALVNLLVTLVTPGVLESIGNAGTRTGAQN